MGIIKVLPIIVIKAIYVTNNAVFVKNHARRVCMSSMKNIFAKIKTDVKKNVYFVIIFAYQKSMIMTKMLRLLNFRKKMSKRKRRN